MAPARSAQPSLDILDLRSLGGNARMVGVLPQTPLGLYAIPLLLRPAAGGGSSIGGGGGSGRGAGIGGGGSVMGGGRDGSIGGTGGVPGGGIGCGPCACIPRKTPREASRRPTCYLP